MGYEGGNCKRCGVAWHISGEACACNLLPETCVRLVWWFSKLGKKHAKTMWFTDDDEAADVRQSFEESDISIRTETTYFRATQPATTTQFKGDFGPLHGAVEIPIFGTMREDGTIEKSST